MKRRREEKARTPVGFEPTTSRVFLHGRVLYHCATTIEEKTLRAKPESKKHILGDFFTFSVICKKKLTQNKFEKGRFSEKKHLGSILTVVRVEPTTAGWEAPTPPLCCAVSPLSLPSLFWQRQHSQASVFYRHESGFPP